MFRFTCLYVFTSKSKMIWESFWRFAIPSTWYYFRQQIEKSSIPSFEKKNYQNWCIKRAIAILSKNTILTIMLQLITILSTSGNTNNFGANHNCKLQNALEKWYRFIATSIQKLLLCSGVRPLTSKWRSFSASASKIASVCEVWSNLRLFEFFSGPPKEGIEDWNTISC